MRYDYKDKEGHIIEREFSMSEKTPVEIYLNGVSYYRVWTCSFNMATKANNRLKMDMDDYSKCSISKDSMQIKDPKYGKVKAQLRLDRYGNEQLVYQSNPCKVVEGVKPTIEQSTKLGTKMEKFL